MKPDDLRFDHDKDRLSSKAMTMGSVPIGSAHDARHADRFRRRYRCASCAFEVDVVVFGTGTGRSVSPLFLDIEEAAGRAEVRASRNAAKEAAQNLKLFPCPRCGRRDATTFVVKGIFQLLAVSGLFCGLAVLSSNARDPSIAWFFWPATVLAPLLYSARIRSKWLRAREHVLTLVDYRSRMTDEDEEREPADGLHEREGTPIGGDPEIFSAPDRDRDVRQAQAYLAMNAPPVATGPATAILVLVVLAVTLFALTR